MIIIKRDIVSLLLILWANTLFASEQPVTLLTPKLPTAIDIKQPRNLTIKSLPQQHVIKVKKQPLAMSKLYRNKVLKAKKKDPHPTLVATSAFKKNTIGTLVKINFDLPVGIKIKDSKVDYKSLGEELVKNLTQQKDITSLQSWVDSSKSDAIGVEMNISM